MKEPTGARKVGETLIEAARSDGTTVAPSRSVIGLARISDSDPNLEHADTAIRALFAQHAAAGLHQTRRKEAAIQDRTQRDQVSAAA